MRLLALILLVPLCAAAPQTLWSWSAWNEPLSNLGGLGYIQLVSYPVLSLPPAHAPQPAPLPAPEKSPSPSTTPESLPPSTPPPPPSVPQPVQDTPEVKRAKEIFLEQYRQAALAAALQPDPRELLEAQDAARIRDANRSRRAAQEAPSTGSALAPQERRRQQQMLVTEPWSVLDAQSLATSTSSGVLRVPENDLIVYRQSPLARYQSGIQPGPLPYAIF